ncbi:MAG: hypothetical protein H0X03_07040 [Nitrosopumilus sp.]|nr:hypothetical protein [Nitrosopumilus sp.]
MDDKYCAKKRGRIRSDENDDGAVGLFKKVYFKLENGEYDIKLKDGRLASLLVPFGAELSITELTAIINAKPGHEIRCKKSNFNVRVVYHILPKGSCIKLKSGEDYYVTTPLLFKFTGKIRIYDPSVFPEFKERGRYYPCDNSCQKCVSATSFLFSY